MTDMTTTFHECVEFDVTTSLKWQRDGGNCVIDVVSAVASLIAATQNVPICAGRRKAFRHREPFPGQGWHSRCSHSGPRLGYSKQPSPC